MKRLGLAPDAITKARRLRRDMTDAERKLWYALKESLPAARFRRQVPLGPYLADFCSHRAMLIIEVDGGQHADAAAYDAQRTAFLEAQGYRVLRVWNNQVFDDLDGVLTIIANTLSSPLVGEDQGGGRPASAGHETPARPMIFQVHPAADAAEPPTQPSPTRGEGSAE